MSSRTNNPLSNPTKLLHRNQLIGVITNPGFDGLELEGDVQLTPAAERYKKMFAWFETEAAQFFQDPANFDKEPPFSDRDLEGWEIEDDKGERDWIGLPGFWNNYTGITYRRTLSPFRCWLLDVQLAFGSFVRNLKKLFKRA